MQKLELIFKKLVSNGKLTKKQIVQKLIEVCGVNTDKTAQGGKDNQNMQQELSILSRSVNGIPDHVDDGFLNENMVEDTSRDSSSRVALEDQRHRHKISNTNSNFYKFRQQQDQIQNILNERPKSSKGGLRSSISNNNPAHH